jgi:TolB-like protein
MHVSDVAAERRREARKDSDEKVAAQMERILSSNVFRQADRLKRFLSFTVNETLAGRGERLKEFVIGIEVFGKGSAFDQRSDPIVRVQARRLRSQLARYYREEGQSDEILIELPKGGYTPVFKSLRGVIPKRASHSALVSRNTILLIPFSDHSEAGDQKYFCDGLTQEIIHTLTGLDAIRLIARAESESDPREAAARDNAAIVLTGSVRKAGGELRIVTNLIDAVSGCYLWCASNRD